MQFDARLSSDAATLAREHGDMLRRLPATVHAFILVELQRWALLFPAEQRYQQALLEHLSQVTPGDLRQLSEGIARVEREAALNRIEARDPSRFQDLAQAALRTRSLLPAWRREVDLFFQPIDPVLESRLYPPERPRRLVVQIYSGDIAVQPGRLWARLKARGMRIPLTLAGASHRDGYLRALFGAAADGERRASFFDRLQDEAGFASPDAWIVESHAALHDLVDRQPPAGRARSLIGLSYERLLPYRDQLMRALFSRIQSGVESPQAFAAYARGLTIRPDPGALFNPDDIVQGFVRDVLLTGNGTLFVNNTFVEWAAVQALKRAQPRVLVARYGVRDRLKPFSSLLLFSQPRTSDQIPLVEDPVGSFVDVEQLSYYVWLQAEKSAAYREKTLYLFLAENQEELLAIRSDMAGPPAPPPAAASLADVSATMAHWIGLRPMEGSGRPIATLVS
jgi:hypothetical protein